ncbi:MAG: SDR family oxidoreductase [Trueperaceae bacterium]|nr:SDR family oxidoreductase [Trueperaceae bacterium]
MRLAGKVAVVTGAGAGMGRAIAHLFAQEGAKVVLGEIAPDRLDTVVKEIRDAGGEVTGVVGNVAKVDDAEALIQAAIDTYGKLDVLVNNAGIMDLFEGVATFKDATYERVMGVNVFGPLATSRAAVRYMKEHGGGAIVNSASAAGVGGAAAGVVYTASKHAIIGITRNTAIAYGHQGIRCNAIAIGAVGDTAIMSGVDMSQADMEALGQFGKWHGLATQLESIDIARVVLFLASDEAKGVNGVVLPVDGGWTAH